MTEYKSELKIQGGAFSLSDIEGCCLSMKMRGVKADDIRFFATADLLTAYGNAPEKAE